MKGDYDNIPACGVEENKANQGCPFGKLKTGFEQRRMEPISCSNADRRDWKKKKNCLQRIIH
jgi:hypothetical protein